jgi:hypothetical protein
VITNKSQILAWISVWAISDAEMMQPYVKPKLEKLDTSINNNNITEPALLVREPNVKPSEKEGPAFEMHGTTPEELDGYLTKEVLLPRGGELVTARVLKRRRDGDGIPTGCRHQNPILDTREYEVELPNSSIGTYTANVIAENLAAQSDIESHLYALFVGIKDHRRTDDSRLFEDADNLNLMTTLGWDMLVKWVNGITSWLPLAALKESNPIKTAKYAVANGLDKEPVFRGWVRKTLPTRDRIISKVKTRYWKKTHKYGIELPKAVRQALAIDARNRDSAWREAIAKEMMNVMPAF